MDVRALPPGYTEWAAPAALRDAVACLWAQVADSSAARAGLVLPDGCTDLIWEQGRGAFVAGPDTGPAPVAVQGGTVLFAVRFRPGAGGPALGLPLSELRDQRVDLADLHPALARLLPGTLDPKTAVSRSPACATGRISPESAISPRTMASVGTGRSERADTSAAATARSAAGSLRR